MKPGSSFEAFLDTTFILPFFQIDVNVEAFTLTKFKEFLTKFPQIHFSELSIFEAKAKLQRLSRKDATYVHALKSFGTNLATLREDEKIIIMVEIRDWHEGIEMNETKKNVRRKPSCFRLVEHKAERGHKKSVPQRNGEVLRVQPDTPEDLKEEINKEFEKDLTERRAKRKSKREFGVTFNRAFAANFKQHINRYD